MKTESQKQILSVIDFYTKTTEKSTGESIYKVWERSGAVNDSVTPSSSSKEYRVRIITDITSLDAPNKTIASLGCGNGFIEAELIKLGYKVKAIDLIDEAVSYACAKGVEAEKANFFDLPDDYFEKVDIVYADGFIGHLFSRESGVDKIIDKLKASGLEKGAFLVLSNDSTGNDDVDLMQHEAVTGFWYFSGKYLKEEIVKNGFSCSRYSYFKYSRPLSGDRDRVISISKY